MKIIRLKYDWHTTDHGTFDTFYYPDIIGAQITSKLSGHVYEFTEFVLRKTIREIRLKVEDIVWGELH